MIENISFKKLDAIKYSNEFVEIVIIPSYGGKMASIKSKESLKEFLFQASEDELRIPEYGADFSKYDSSGFDEVFPSIDICPYPDGPHKNIEVPDHGEVWAMPWIIDISEEFVKLSVTSKNFDYKLEKIIKLNKNKIKINYKVTNLGNHPFKFIWTPHALLNCNENTRIIVPKRLDTIINVEKSSEHLGQWGEIHSYPLTLSKKDGKIVDMSRVEGIEANNCEKFYFTEKLEENECCGIEYEDTLDKIIYRYDTDKIPYLGIWKTQGGYRGDYNIALEPCTGVYDNLYIGDKIGKVPVIEGKEEYNWNFEIEIAKMESK
jgi:galactose mutarotase-like enzyme